ncbi:MAG: hypothetical protein A2527_14740 [Candidatus Lambdaproteobacteria bacterium RIFOXYD2_FULL_50_16]|uniref:Helix-turn-helix domain-containing protein n=1 Tax=Candidatus Lambdaproteobacteria bacterium RIFOXYD2_FULL_50_16 TaxID=1817772 RepID=A0A1F6G5P2_9PROT|nr:MAG: hypothetical protein A2527_14740 [Candidatus Lambdaproteobacteria bacterium RIFOXYD2_FULL_50_16]
MKHHKDNPFPLSDQPFRVPDETKMPPDLRLYSIPAAAQALGVKERTIKHHLYEASDLKYLILGREVRIRYQDLVDFLAQRTRVTIHEQNLLPPSSKRIPNVPKTR